jgi:hypothetical protein
VNSCYKVIVLRNKCIHKQVNAGLNYLAQKSKRDVLLWPERKETSNVLCIKLPTDFCGHALTRQGGCCGNVLQNP